MKRFHVKRRFARHLARRGHKVRQINRKARGGIRL